MTKQKKVRRKLKVLNPNVNLVDDVLFLMVDGSTICIKKMSNKPKVHKNLLISMGMISVMKNQLRRPDGVENMGEC